MSSPSPSKPKWSPGGAIRRTSTILSMGRSKTPSRSSSLRESDSSSTKGVTAEPATPPPKPVSPKSTLTTGSPTPKEPAVTPSKSPLARMGTVLRRPSTLIPRRRTTSTASSFRDGDAKSAAAIRSSTETKAIRTAEPESLVPAESRISEPEAPKPQQSAPEEPAHVPPPVIESVKEVQSTEKPEEIPPIGQLPLSTLRSEHASPTTQDSGDELAAEPGTTLLITEQISTEPEVVKESSPASITTAEPASEEISAEPKVEEPAIVPLSTAELPPVFTPPPTNLVPPSPEEPTVSTPAQETIPAEPTDLAPTIVEDVPPSPSPATHDTIVEEPAVVASPPPAVVTDVSVSTPEQIVVEPLREVSSLNSSFEDLAMSTQPQEDEVAVVQKDVVMHEPSMTVDVAPVPAGTDEEEVPTIVAVLQDVVVDEPSILLNPVDVASEPEEGKRTAVLQGAVVDEPSMLLGPLDVLSVPVESKEEEKVSTVATLPVTEEPWLIRGNEPPLSKVTKENDWPAVVEASALSVPPVTQEPQRTLQLTVEISTNQVESAAPSPSATHPLLPLEIQETSARQSVGLVGSARDHHTKTPQEYRSLLSKLLDGLVDLIRHWRRCIW